MGYLVTYDIETGAIEEYGDRPDEKDDLGQKTGRTELLHNTDEYGDLAVMAKGNVKNKYGNPDAHNGLVGGVQITPLTPNLRDRKCLNF